MPTVRDRIDEAVRLLTEVSETPRADAEFLMAHLLGVARARLPMHLDEPADVPQYRILVERRLAYEPIPYILGEWEFFSVPLKTRAPVLVPRPETEHLVEIILNWCERRSDAPRILELCTGTGCIAIALAMNLPGAYIIATDLGDEALTLAEENIRMHSLEQRVSLRRGDLFNALCESDGPFDIVCANPPYVEEEAFAGLAPSIRLYEDPRALLAGPDGLDTIRRIVSEARKHLVQDGMLALEIGDGQYDAVSELMLNAGFSKIGVCNDLAGIRRIIHAYA